MTSELMILEPHGRLRTSTGRRIAGMRLHTLNKVKKQLKMMNMKKCTQRT